MFGNFHLIDTFYVSYNIHFCLVLNSNCLLPTCIITPFQSFEEREKNTGIVIAIHHKQNKLLVLEINCMRAAGQSALDIESGELCVYLCMK